MIRYIPNHRSDKAYPADHPSALVKPRPQFENKAAYRKWCASPDTDHVFFSVVEGDTPGLRVSKDNPPRMIHGLVGDYDAAVDWDTIDTTLMQRGSPPPTWRSKTFSGYLRVLWEFEKPVPIQPEMFSAFVVNLATTIRMEHLAAGFDKASLGPGQYFEIGEDWHDLGTGPLPHDMVLAALFRASALKPPQSEDDNIPFEDVAAEIERQFPGVWPAGQLEVGARGPLFWLQDGIDREGCRICPDGVLCFSSRAPKPFMSWRDILGSAFVDQYSQQKAGILTDNYWFDGKMFYKVINGVPQIIPKEQLGLELRQAGFNKTPKKGAPLSELEKAVLLICNNNRVDAVAPVVFSKETMVRYNGQVILNTSRVTAVEPAASGDPALWPFIHRWINQLFHNPANRPATDYFFAWLQRFYRAVLDKQLDQGQTLVLVGPTGRGKSLLSNKVISGLVGGFADASHYLSGHTKFNKDLARVAAWVVDDTTSSASFADQRKATELIKRAAANPRIEHEAKYFDAITLPWAGRVIMSLNMDANSLSVLPALDSSNRDKILALRISDNSTSSFPTNTSVEATILNELPHFGRWLLDTWVTPADLQNNARYGVHSYVEESIAEAAFDNSSRSVVSEWVESFVKNYRKVAPNDPFWIGTLTDMRLDYKRVSDDQFPGGNGHLEFFRRGMQTLEESSQNSPQFRPIKSEGKGSGKVWTVSLDPKYDLIPDTSTSNSGVNTEPQAA